MEVIKASHSMYCLQYHVVWVRKHRRKILKPGVCSYIRKTLPGLLRGMPGVKVETIGFDTDHIHMLMTIPPRYSISSVMGRFEKPIVVADAEVFSVVVQGVLE